MMPEIPPLWALLITILILSAGQTLFASILLVVAKHDNKPAQYFLSIFMLTLSTAITLLFLFDFWVTYFPHVILSYYPLLFILPPMLWFYVGKLTRPDIPIKPASILMHLIPAGIVVLMLSPFFSLSEIDKIEWHYFRRSNYIEFSDVQLWTYKIVPLTKYLCVLQGETYMFLGLRLLFMHQKRIKNQFSNIDNIQLRWLYALLGCCVFIYTFSLIDMLYSLFTGNTAWIINIVTGCTLLCIFGYFGIVQKNVYVMPPLPLDEELIHSLSPDGLRRDNLSNDTGVFKPSETVKYQSSNLSDSHVKELYKDLLDYMDQEKPYLNPSLAIQELAESMQLPARELSRIINQMAGKNFLDFINGYRINGATKMLCQKTDMNVLDVAMSSGFNSKSSFYQAFKKSTGMTPSQYRKKGQKQEEVL